MIYKEIDVDNHPIISELDKMRDWVRSVPLKMSGNQSNRDLSLEKLDDRISGVPNNAYLSRFNFLDDFDFGLIESYSGEIYSEYTETSDFSIIPVARTWYPKGGYLGWHIDNDGGRLYSTWADGKSYFRYRDPFTGEIVTSWDRINQWTFRIFTFDSENPLWHCVSADDVRISIGYRFI